MPPGGKSKKENKENKEKKEKKEKKGRKRETGGKNENENSAAGPLKSGPAALFSGGIAGAVS